MLQENGVLELPNPYLKELHSDHLYHLGIKIANTKNTADVEKEFGDVKFICMGGTKSRMESLARHLQKELKVANANDELVDLSAHAHRYALFKVGPVICCSHGMGMASMSILLHELLKLVKYANCKSPIFIRIGSCGGLGLPPGSVVITENAYNGYLRNEHEIAILGKRIVRPAKFDSELANQLLNCAEPSDNFFTIVGNTLACDCFYEGQGRLDGAVCNYTKNDKMDFLKKCHHEFGIRNIEMEATMFASLMSEAQIRAADVCVTLVNRLLGDQVEITNEDKKDFEERPLTIIVRFIKKTLYDFSQE